MKLEKQVLANAFCLATVSVWVLCSLLVALLPKFSMRVFSWWMHGMDVSVLGNWNLTWSNFLLGGLTLAFSAWVTGWIFGWAWEKASKK